jgi:HD superfamily phosphohydrolase
MQRNHGVRDPVHKWIQFSPEEKKIIDSPLVQRLRWIAQLTCTNQVFPGGTNDRFSHSLGAMHLAGKYMKQLTKTSLFSSKKKHYVKLARITALLHDIGHGPFSHAYDRSVYPNIYSEDHDKGHDLHRIALIRSTLLKPLIEGCGVSVDEVCSCWSDDGDNIYHIIHLITQGPLGADRMDFTLRDSYFTGTEHLGTISPHRVISNASLEVEESSGKLHLVYNTKAFSDITQALNERFRMYDCVYLHRAAYGASILLEKIMSLATPYLRLVERTLDPEQFLYINDYTLIGEIMSSVDESTDMVQCREYCRRLLNRQLPHLVTEQLVFEEDSPEAEAKIVLQEGQILVRTRRISALDPSDFDNQGIQFKAKSGELFSCAETLQLTRTIVQPPFHYLRVYDLS